MVECLLPKQDVTGSNPVARSSFLLEYLPKEQTLTTLDLPQNHSILVILLSLHPLRHTSVIIENYVGRYGEDRNAYLGLIIVRRQTHRDSGVS